MAQEQEQELDILNMSDDEIDEAIAAEMNRLEQEEDSSEEEPEAVAEGDDEEDTDEPEEGEDDDEDSEDGEAEDEDEDENKDSSDDSEGESDASDESDEESDDESEGTDDVDSKEDQVDSESEIDYKTQYEEILKPFKANGREIKVDNIEDVRTLMQMGANYNKKMAALKPSLKIVKMLENQGLLDESKISYLIDLDKKDPEAIKKLIKDSGTDPLDIDTNQVNYNPGTYTVSDGEVELDGILAEIRDTSSYNETLDVIGNKWDEKSRQQIAQSPEVIRVINDHIQSGIFKQVSAEVERERILGRLSGLSDIEAYKQVGDAINARGGFAGTAQNQQAQPQSTSNSTNVSKTNKKADPKTTNRKKAASSTKGKPRQSDPEGINPLSLSDEEFEKMATSKFV